MSGYSPSPIRRESVISKAAEELCRFIEAERLAPGSRLPTEIHLSRMLGISRNSLREALRVLDGLGFVEKRPGAGIRVKGSFGMRSEPDQESLVLDAAPVAFQVRTVVEARCAELAARAGTEGDLAELAGHLALFEEALKRGDPVSAVQAHAAFHDALVRAARNPFLASIFQQVRFVVSEIGRRGGQKTYKNPRQVRAHREIYEAVWGRDAQRAAAAVHRHFEAAAPLVEFVARSQRAVAGDPPETPPGSKR